MRLAKVEQSKLARTDQELIELAASDADWFLRSSEDLDQLRAAPDNPISKLSPEDYQAFSEKLIFRNGGVAGGYYKPLMNSLNLPEIVQVFALMGMSMELFTSDETTSCQECACGGGGCTFDFWSFCSSLCGTTAEA
jgi:hypothetical protein